MFKVLYRLHKWPMILSSLMLTIVLLSACGDNTSASQPAATTVASNSAVTTTAGVSSSAASATTAATDPNIGNTTPGANAPAGGGPGRGQFGGQLISGTVDSYDAAQKRLVVKGTDGKTQQIAASNPVLVKNSKVTTDELSKLLTDTTVLSLQGDKASDGTYTARDVTVITDPAGQFGGNGTPGVGRFPGGNFTPGAANNGTPGAGGRQPGLNGNGNAPLLIRGAKLAAGKLTGTSMTGEAITALLSNATVLTSRSAGNISDLKSGLVVSVRVRPAQDTTTPVEALTITYTAG